MPGLLSKACRTTAWRVPPRIGQRHRRIDSGRQEFLFTLEPKSEAPPAPASGIYPKLETAAVRELLKFGVGGVCRHLRSESAIVGSSDDAFSTATDRGAQQ